MNRAWCGCRSGPPGRPSSGKRERGGADGDRARSAWRRGKRLHRDRGASDRRSDRRRTATCPAAARIVRVRSSLLTQQQLEQLAKRPAGEAESGTFVLRLSPRLRQPSDDAKTLMAVANELQMTELSKLLAALNITDTQRVVPGITREQVDDPSLPPDVAQSKKRLRSYWLVSAVQHRNHLPKVIEQFSQLPEVDIAYKAFRFGEPTVHPGDNPYSVLQGYVDPAPKGIDARYVWKQINGAGTSTGLVDVERGWYPDHEDFASKRPMLIDGGMRPGSQRHGTAVLGEVIADDNHVGGIGIAPSADYVFLSSYFNDSTMTDGSVPAAIFVALLFLDVGDVLLLEVEENDRLLPAEVDDAVFDAIRLSVMLGVTVVAAGGNGAQTSMPTATHLARRFSSAAVPTFATPAPSWSACRFPRPAQAHLLVQLRIADRLLRLGPSRRNNRI